MRNLQTLLRLKIAGTEYLLYTQAMECLGLSAHPHQLVRRMRQYPAHFIVYQGEQYMSYMVAQALQQYHMAVAQLNHLKTKGGNYE